jgi:hypothetical protein
MVTVSQANVDLDDSEFEGVVLEFIDEAEAASRFDLRAREWLQMSGPEFKRAFCAGELDIEAPHVGMLYMLMGPLACESDAG